jgi:hypothetical protein
MKLIQLIILIVLNQIILIQKINGICLNKIIYKLFRLKTFLIITILEFLISINSNKINIITEYKKLLHNIYI